MIREIFSLSDLAAFSPILASPPEPLPRNSLEFNKKVFKFSIRFFCKDLASVFKAHIETFSGHFVGPLLALFFLAK
jgi:hypothetical protein